LKIKTNKPKVYLYHCVTVFDCIYVYVKETRCLKYKQSDARHGSNVFICLSDWWGKGRISLHSTSSKVLYLGTYLKLHIYLYHIICNLNANLISLPLFILNNFRVTGFIVENQNKQTKSLFISLCHSF